MAGTTLAGELRSPAGKDERPASGGARVRYAEACRADEAEIRRLLRENPMRGRITVSFEREPDFFAGQSADDVTVIGRDDGRVVVVGRATVRMRFVDGQPRRIAYLGELRLDASARGRAAVVRGGYGFLRDVLREHAVEAMFTSIASDNERARRFLERGLPGMPRYRPVAEYVTTVIAVPGRRIRGERDVRASRIESGDADALVGFLGGESRRRDLALAWTRADLDALAASNLFFSNFRIVREGGRIVAAGALWDQRHFRQTVIRGYGRGLAVVRPAYNAFARLMHAPELPAIGTALAIAHVSPLIVAAGQDASVVDLVRAMYSEAETNGIGLLDLAFAEGDPAQAIVRRAFRGREYRSRLYQVDWPDEPAALVLGNRIVQPEVALL